MTTSKPISASSGRVLADVDLDAVSGGVTAPMPVDSRNPVEPEQTCGTNNMTEERTTMGNPSENTVRPLSLSELEAVCAAGVTESRGGGGPSATESRGFIGEKVSNNASPPMVDGGCGASESNGGFAFCPRE